MDMKQKAKRTAFLIGFLAATSAFATIQEHTFSITGDHGETGTGSFTWDDTVVPDGSQLNASDTNISPNVLSIDITINGGNIVGGTTHFTRADCSGAVMQNTPDFASDINFWCDNGTNTLAGVEVYTNDLNSGSSTLTFAPGSTAPAASVSVPLFGPLGSAVLVSLFGFFGYRRLKA